MEYGINIQNQRSTNILPVTTDIAFTTGFKATDQIVFGGGISYRLGWGDNWNHISFSHQGVGFRSYVDMKLKGSIWISGGLEYNYMQEFRKWQDISNINTWQHSGLIGLTKKYKIGKKEQKLQLLWDFLCYQQIPRGQALKFRIGYNF